MLDKTAKEDTVAGQDQRDSRIHETGGCPSSVLQDGLVVELAPMKISDGPRLLRFHETLSDRTTYLRFFSVHPHLSSGEVDRFVNVDHRDREAIVASVDGELVAVGRFDRLDDGSQAEVALLVGDAFQGRGLGRLLFDRLVERAQDVGVEHFVADVLSDNHRMLHLFHHTGLPIHRRFDGGVVHLVLDLPGRGRRVPWEAPTDRSRSRAGDMVGVGS